MKTITANTAIKNVWSAFGVQPVTPSETVTMSISVDGVTYTALDTTFDGAHVFRDCPIGLYIKFNKNVVMTENIQF